MNYVDSQEQLESLCNELGAADYICLDTEFMRERTFYPQLCLIQLAVPGSQFADSEKPRTANSEPRTFAVDPLANLDLKPLLEILTDAKLIIIHSGRQDFEILYNLTGKLPKTVFDCQIAAMVCGFGEQVSYQELVRQFCNTDIDKSQRYTDWAKRPLSEKQISYALSDVIYLPEIYKKLNERLDSEERKLWLEQEDAELTNLKNYADDPDNAWQRIKHRDKKHAHLGVLMEVTKWRDAAARQQNKPRRWVIKDESLIEIALRKPHNAVDLLAIRNIGSLNKTMSAEIISAVERGLTLAKNQIPVLKKPPKKSADPAVVDLLKLLFKHKCLQNDVASKLMGSTEEIEKLANGNKSAFSDGWRYELFGRDAEKLMAGELTFSVDSKSGKLKIS